MKEETTQMGIMQTLARMMGTPKTALVEASGDYVDAVDADDDLWTPVRAGRRRDLNPVEARKARRISLHLWRRNPAAHRLIEWGLRPGRCRPPGPSR
jgi:hypothetical protein